MRKSLWILAGLAVLLAAPAGYLKFMASRRIEAQRARFELAGLNFDFDDAYVRERREDGGVELAAFFPNFAPAAREADITSHTDVAARFAREVFLTLKPADSKLDPGDRTERLYERFLSPTSWTHPGGLTARGFEPGSPFDGDELFYVAPDGRAFAARCHRPKPDLDLPNTCLAGFRAGPIDIEMRFAADLLSEWEALNAGARGLLEAAKR